MIIPKSLLKNDFSYSKFNQSSFNIDAKKRDSLTRKNTDTEIAESL